jgi:hypothetical protein
VLPSARASVWLKGVWYKSWPLGCWVRCCRNCWDEPQTLVRFRAPWQRAVTHPVNIQNLGNSRWRDVACKQSSVLRFTWMIDWQTLEEIVRLPHWGKVEFYQYPPKRWEDILKGASTQSRDLVSRLVRYECRLRLSAADVCYFTQYMTIWFPLICFAGRWTSLLLSISVW